MFLYIILFLILAVILYINFYPAFGRSPKDESKQRYEKSLNYLSGKFKNNTLINMNFQKGVDPNPDYIADPKIGKVPQQPLPTIKFDKIKFKETDANQFAWFGHSTIIFKIENKIVISDPVFKRASPFPFLIGPRPFKYENKITIDDLPDKIDIILITHDHYDHLDYSTIKILSDRVELFLVPLGVKAHLQQWKIPVEKIIEFDWYDKSNYNGIKFIFTPAQHFSGRALRDRNNTFWGGWIIQSNSAKFYISGDGGYNNEFKNIGDKYGPFDIAFIENGAYNVRWADVHLFPEEGVQVGFDVKATYSIPIHWGKFNLSFHNWKEPIERFTNESVKQNLKIITPRIGQIIKLNSAYPIEKWWKELK